MQLPPGNGPVVWSIAVVLTEIGASRDSGYNPQAKWYDVRVVSSYSVSFEIGGVLRILFL